MMKACKTAQKTAEPAAEQKKRAEPAAPVCRPVFPKRIPDEDCDIPKRLMSHLPFLAGITTQELIAALRAAPQYAGLPLAKLFREQRGGLRVIFLAQTPYYAQQAALYLATLSHLERERRAPKEDGFWSETELDELLGESEKAGTLENSLVLVSAGLLDPALEQGKRTLAASPMQLPTRMLRLSALKTHAVLVWAQSGAVLTEQTMSQLEELTDRDVEENPLDLFVTLTPGQMDREALEELRFGRGFHVCRIGQPDEAYLDRFLRRTIEEITGLPAAEGLDTAAVTAGVRRCRKGQLDERDLVSLVLWAQQRGVKTPLTEKDLCMTPYEETEKSGWEELKGMAGLETVKQELRRRLASAALEDRRRRLGRPVQPAWRSLAFAGPPGTGKSVTARLAARILCEEGCGTGRFVEAGREQLIGKYLGHTSPQIADLFDQARGGVLFIDEAGALLGGERDDFANEAVNALVRHMELEPQTMVIFATYPDEMERLLAANPGLSSRVSQVLRFEGYDDDTLCEILAGFAQKDGETLPEGAAEAAKRFFGALRAKKGKSFGNGREARRLYQAAVDEMALRVMEGQEEALTLADFETAAERLLVMPGERKTNRIGF